MRQIEWEVVLDVEVMNPNVMTTKFERTTKKMYAASEEELRRILRANWVTIHVISIRRADLGAASEERGASEDR